MENKLVCQEANLKLNVVWLLLWNGICQCKKKQTGYGCCCSKIKLEILQKQLWMHSINSIPDQQNLLAHAPLLIAQPHQMASVQNAGLSWCSSKTKSIADMTTYLLDKPSYFLFQDAASEVSYAWERIIIIPYLLDLCQTLELCRTAVLFEGFYLIMLIVLHPRIVPHHIFCKHLLLVLPYLKYSYPSQCK